FLRIYCSVFANRLGCFLLLATLKVCLGIPVALRYHLIVFVQYRVCTPLGILCTLPSHRSILCHSIYCWCTWEGQEQVGVARNRRTILWIFRRKLHSYVRGMLALTSSRLRLAFYVLPCFFRLLSGKLRLLVVLVIASIGSLLTQTFCC